MEFLLATAVIVVILIIARGLHQFVLRLFCDAVQAAPAPARRTDRIVQQAVADLDREYEDLVRRYR